MKALGDKLYSCQESKDYWLHQFSKVKGKPMLARDITPLRYPGGKGAFKYFLANTVLENIDSDGFIVEPFCGGCGATLPLLESGIVSGLAINDANPAIAAFWKSVFFDTDALNLLILSTPVTIGQWHRWKDAIMHPEQASTLELGFAAFFMNRCNRSGLLNAGPIGGLSQLGNYKIDCRFNRKDLVRRIGTISSFRDRVSVSCMDAVDFLSSLDGEYLKKAIIFIDPPYVRQGKSLYQKYSFDPMMHREFSEYIKSKPWKWLITYDDHPLVRELYAERALGVVEFSYFMQRAKIGRELIVASSLCRIPFPPVIGCQKSESVGGSRNSRIVQKA